jgi:hypothetical protein
MEVTVRKVISALVVTGLIAGAMAAPAEAGKKKKPKRVTREVQGAYDAPALIVVGGCAQTGAIGCVSIVTGPKEKFLTAKINDAHGQAAFVAISSDSNGDAQDDTSHGFFCGETSESISVPPATELHLWVGLQADTNFPGCAPGVATNGTIDVTLSNLP